MIEILTVIRRSIGPVKAEFSLLINGLQINGIRLVEDARRPGDLFVSYPYWTEGEEKEKHLYVIPKDEVLKADIESRLIKAYNAVTDTDQPDRIAPTQSLRDVNLRLKHKDESRVREELHRAMPGLRDGEVE